MIVTKLPLFDTSHIPWCLADLECYSLCMYVLSQCWMQACHMLCPGIPSVLCAGEGTVLTVLVTASVIKTIISAFSFKAFFLYELHERLAPFCIVVGHGE